MQAALPVSKHMLLLLQATQRGDGTEAKWDVFLSHAGEQKKDFVDLMHAWLTEVHRLKCFLDEHSLRRGDFSWEQMEKSLRLAAVGQTFFNITC